MTDSLDSFKERGALQIKPQTSKTELFQFIKDKMNKNSTMPSDSTGAVTNDANFRYTRQTGTPTMPTYTIEFKNEVADKAYNEKMKTKPADIPPTFTNYDMLIYLSELRKNYKNKIPPRMKTFHDTIYTKLSGLSNKDRYELLRNDAYMSNIGDKLWFINANYKNYDSAMNKLDSVFSKKIDNHEAKVPSKYLTALQQMKDAITNMTKFVYKYVDGGVEKEKDIFDERYVMYPDPSTKKPNTKDSKDTSFSNLKLLASRLNEISFDRLHGNQIIEDTVTFTPWRLKDKKLKIWENDDFDTIIEFLCNISNPNNQNCTISTTAVANNETPGPFSDRSRSNSGLSDLSDSSNKSVVSKTDVTTELPANKQNWGFGINSLFNQKKNSNGNF
jgi:hypothetical protein